MQITWELFEIAKGLAKTSQQTSRLNPIQTTSFYYLHSNELISFDYFLNVFFSFHAFFIPLKFNQDKNLELLTREFYSRYKSQVTNLRTLIKIKISSYKLNNFILIKISKLLTRKLTSSWFLILVF